MFVIKYYSFKGDLLFDPFGGSGTFGQVANEQDRNFFLTEIDSEYFKRIKERLSETNIDKNYFELKDFEKWMQQEK